MLLAVIITAQSCVSPKKLYYFHNKVPGTQQIDRSIQSPVQLIKPGDRLRIQVSIADPAQAAFLNPYSSVMGGGQQGGQQGGGSGFLVNKEGKINFPTLGYINVLGRTPEQVADTIKTKLEFLYKDPFVIVNLQGSVYFMSGRSGSVIPITNERLTIFEAITQASSNDPYDLRNQMWLIREENNERSFVKINLTDSSIFNSPYYYLRNNDQLYMKPGKFSNAFAANSPFGFALALSGVLLTLILLIRSF